MITRSQALALGSPCIAILPLLLVEYVARRILVGHWPK